MRKLQRSPFDSPSARRRRFSPLLLVGAIVSLAIALAGGVVFLLPRVGSHAAAAVNMDCTLIVPAQPLTAQGLARPYQLLATNPENGPCNESNPNQAAFVQAAIIDPATGQISIYDPLVIDQGTQPAIPPVVPGLPARGVVAIWFGANSNTLTLQSMNHSLRNGHCVNGIDNSIFGQVSYCNARAFFQAGKLVPPPLGIARDGLPCPTVRDFSVVDQDQSDNVTTTYLVTSSGQTAQMTAANMIVLQNRNIQVQHNGSDNRLLAIALDGALGCKPWMAPDLADPGQMTTALPLNELQAAAHQAAPVPLVPTRDPMDLLNGHPDLNKLNAYRIGVDQPKVQSLSAAGTKTYCTNLFAIAPQRMLLDASLTKTAPSADPAVANTLFTFLAQRFVTTFEANGLNCKKSLGVPDPVSVKTDGNGVAVDATITDTTIFTPINCSGNGTVITGCTGTTTVQGRACRLKFDGQGHQGE